MAAHQVIRQPDGLYAVFSTITDTWVVCNATEDEITDWFVERAAAAAREQITETLGHVRAGNPQQVYYQFAMPFDEANDLSGEHGGLVLPAAAKGER